MAQFRARKIQCDGTIGDINGDGRCDWNDFIMIQDLTMDDTCYPSNPNYLGHSICCTADISGAGSGGVNATDVSLLGNWLLNHCSDLEDSDTCDGSCPGETIPPIGGGGRSGGGGRRQLGGRGRTRPVRRQRGGRGRVRRQQGGNGNGLPKPWGGK